MPKPDYEDCSKCEGMGFLVEVEPKFVEGDENESGLFVRFSVGIDRARQVICPRCEGLRKVPVKQA